MTHFIPSAILCSQLFLINSRNARITLIISSNCNCLFNLNGICDCNGNNAHAWITCDICLPFDRLTPIKYWNGNGNGNRHIVMHIATAFAQYNSYYYCCLLHAIVISSELAGLLYILFSSVH